MRPGRIVDTHHHLWDLHANYYPWLTDRVVWKPYGDYAAIRRDYMPADLKADIGALPVVKSVHLNAGHDRSDPVRETRWLQALADDTARSGGFPHALVADADLTAPDVAGVLEAHCAFPLMRGIRAILSESIRYPGQHPELLDDAGWCERVGLLPRLGLSLDLQLYPQQMTAAARLAARYPNLPIMVNHTGLPEDRSVEGRQRWRGGLRAMAAQPNVALKISAFGVCDPGWTEEGIRPLVREAIAIFGPDRCMFGSNFPVDRLFGSYARTWDSFMAATDDMTADEVDALYYGNAVRLYRL
jgi:predicted TIM-barrel fold metal-dependent hydrolase